MYFFQVTLTVLWKFSLKVITAQELCAQLLVMHSLLPVAVVTAALKDGLEMTFQSSIPTTPLSVLLSSDTPT